MKNSRAKKFCRCIKKVAKTVRLRNGQGSKEGAAIAICTKSVLQTRGRTLKRVSCTKKGGPHLQTQRMKRE